jgi:hypothetical protein
VTGFITVMLVACLNAANPATCTKLPITDNTQAQADDAPLTITGCMGVEGMETARKYWEEHPDLHKNYQFGGWACRIGNKQLPDGGKA